MVGPAMLEQIALVRDWFARAGIKPTGHGNISGGSLLNLACPFRHHDEDGTTGILIFPDRVAFKCFHAKCKGKSIKDIERLWGERLIPHLIEVDSNAPRVTDEAVESLASAANLYQRGGRLVRITHGSPPPKGLDRPPNVPAIEYVSTPALREILASEATYRKWSAREKKYIGIDVPDKIVANVLARPTWPVPTLEAIATTPVLRPDGSILAESGFDKATGLFLDTAIKFEPMPVAEAVVLLLEAVADFPFERSEHKAAWLAACLTPLARLAIDGPTPLNAIDGNVRGAGKGLLIDVISHIVTGGPMSRTTAPANDDEWRKRITSIAQEGDSLILIDNVGGTLGSPSFDAALTATTWKDRALGENRMLSAPLNVVWYATGNNIIFAADTSRRTLHIRLESPLEKPEERSDFRHPDLLGWIKENRSRLVSAALSILKGYCDAGRPDQRLVTWGSFEKWSALIRNAIVWAGLPDPGLTRGQLSEQSDDDRATLGALIEGWLQADPERKGMTIGDALRIEHEHPALAAALADLGSRDKRTALSYQLRRFKHRVLNGQRFERDDSRHARWRVVTIC
jgi:hypothetical protein